jgi:phospholipid transport system substrate-binding protein
MLASVHIRAAVLGMLYALSATYASAADERPAVAVVEKLQATLLDVMKNAKTLGTHGRYDKLKPVVEEVHDFAYILRAVLGPTVTQLTPDQLQQAVAAFGDTSTAIYAHEFNNYSGEHFATLEEKSEPRGTRIVRTVMQTPGKTDAHFDYLLRQVDGNWRIVNTIADGVSQLAIDRTQAQAALKQGGFDGLMAWIRGRVPKD